MNREPTINGGERDAVSRYCRRLYDPPAGVRRYWRQKMNRRARRRQRSGIKQVQWQHGTLVLAVGFHGQGG